MVNSASHPTPGISAVSTSVERQPKFGNDTRFSNYESTLFSSTARDSGSSPTTVLRPGTILGQITSTLEWAQYDPSATDGTQIARRVTDFEVNVLDQDGSAQDIFEDALTMARLVESELWNFDEKARRDLAALGFVFDTGNPPASLINEHETGTTRTATAAENDNCFVGQGASLTVTLPAIAVGLRYGITSDDVNKAVAFVSAASENIHGGSGADTATIAADADSINRMVVEAQYIDGSLQWVVIHSSATPVLS